MTHAMPLNPSRELLAFQSPLVFSADDSSATLDRLQVKGFASVETDDRSGDHTDPFEFNVDEFMAAPTLLMNHKFWIDHMVNTRPMATALPM